MQSNPQLFCFTHAGGNTSFFNEIKEELPDLNLIPLEYAGHGIRHREEFYENFLELSEDLFRQIEVIYRGGKYGLFGYSMGSISLVEVLKRIISAKMELPYHVFLAAHEPQTKSELLGFTPNELDDWVKERTLEFGAVPEALISNRVFWRTYLPIYRADYSLIAKYDFTELNLKTKIPASIFYSETDTPYEYMSKWRDYFVGECNFRQFVGTHFFIRDFHREMAEYIEKKMGVAA